MDDKEEKSSILKDHKVPFYKLFLFADRVDIALMTMGIFGAIGEGLTQPLMTLIFGQIINSFGGAPSSNEKPNFVLLYYIGIETKCVSLLLNIITGMSCWMVTGERQAIRIRGLYLKTILRQDIAFFDTETTTGQVIGRMSGDTFLIQDALGDKVGKFIQYLSAFVGGFIIAFTKGWLLSLVLVSCIPALVIAGGAMASIMSKMSSRGQMTYAQAGDIVEQTVGAMKTVAAFNGEKLAMIKYDNTLKIAYAFTVQQGLVSGVGLGTFLLVLLSTYGLAIWYGSKLIIEKGYRGGDVINVLMAIMIGGMSLGQTTPSLNAFAAGQVAALKIFETISRKPLIDTSDMSGVVLEDIEGEIELKDVYFRYPARPDVQIFSGFSLVVPSGKTVALVGQSGSGKSTIISLLERFYDPEVGEVLIDGVNLKKYQLKWLRQQMGLVSQEPILFATTIRENISYGKENATEEEIYAAIELANAANFIDKLPQGLDTMVGEHGTQLSGGQKQRLAIARAIVKNPKILLLDEATSALDAESERIVQEALEKVIAKRTTVVVAHRLTTIRKADLIAVLHDGKLLEQGNHDKLMQDPNGAYSQLMRMQGGDEEENVIMKNMDSDKVVITMKLENLSRSSSPQLSAVKQITSHESSRHSFTLSYPVREMIDIHEAKIGDVDKKKDDEQSSENRKKIPIRRLAELNKPELPYVLLGSLAAIMHGLVMPLFGLLLSEAIKSFFNPPQKLRNESQFWGLMYVGLGVVIWLVIPFQNYLFGVAGGKLIERIRSLTFKKVVHQEISWFDDPANSSGALCARLSIDASTVRTVVGDALALIVQNMATALGGLAIAFTANWILAFIILVVLPLICAPGLFQTKFHKGYTADAKVMYEEASQIANDAVGSIRTVASFCAEEKVMDMYQKKCDGPIKKGVKIGIISGASLGFGSFTLYSSLGFCFFIGSVLIDHRLATVDQVFKVFFALILAAVGITQSTTMAPNFNKAKDSITSIFDILDRKSMIDSSSDVGTTLAAVHGDIEFRLVSYRYATRPDVQIFKDLCLIIPSGKTVALVGESGSGKSTVISLIERFYDPESGEIYLDGVEIKQFNLSWLRQQMGLVSQEPILFNETIRDNIAYSRQGKATEEEITEAAKSANAHNFISSLPQGYETSVGERGIQLSGGQKQRIAVARAILKDPKILLLDEATSALDAESERIVQEALDRVMVNRTTVVVAHRLTTIKGADIIAVMKNGVIAEKGRHDVLMNIKDGAYASLVALHMTSA
ncbi:ABC transporter B family member 9-like isoform X3 [Solanum stenotomum]|uniref:ABC transporter B family member 9-like isoform X3 n=1 Tax=Solanum stenotomum TaxID=172797 RepID=UPI0020D08FB2|nr:ABC transporter B family member 9-like isoform X3 [Solanum stenotomum]